MEHSNVHVIIGVDPGSFSAGISVLNVYPTGKIAHYNSAQIELPKKACHGERYVAMMKALAEAIDWTVIQSDIRSGIVSVALEEAVCRHGGKSQITTHESRAPVHMITYDKLGKPPILITTQVARTSIGLKGNAKKSSIPPRVKLIFPELKQLDAKKNEDLFDAVAIAYAYALQVKMHLLSERGTR